jgi:O-antigen/teichoic acid export membrane protein
MAGSFLLAKRRFRLEWDKSAARDIFSFGAGMFLSSVTYFFVSEAERLVVAKVITVAELGCFSLALTVSAMPGLAFGQVIGQVFFPVISKIARSDPEKAVIHYGRMRQLLLILCLIFSVGFILLGPAIVNVVLGPRYAAAGWMLQLLGFRGAFQLFSNAATVMLFALGYSRYAAAGNTARFGFLALGLTIALTWLGFREAIWVLTLSQIVAYVPLLFGIRRHFPAALKAEVWYAVLLLGVSALTALLIVFWPSLAWKGLFS